MRARGCSDLERLHTMESVRDIRGSGTGEPRSQTADLVRLNLLGSREATNVPETGITQESDLLLRVVLHAFDVLGMGWIACDASSHVLALNRTAESIVRNRDGLELDRNDVLRAAFEEKFSLAHAVRRAAESLRLKSSGEQDATFRVRRPSGEPPLTVLVCRIQGSSLDGSGPPVALVLTLDSSVRSKITDVDLYELYRLTSRESSLARLLMEGRTLKDCCCELDIDLSTGKTHLKNIFKKTRVRRQSDLIMLLYKGIGFARIYVETSKTNTSLHGTAVH